MGCTLRDFRITSKWKSERTVNGRILEMATAKSKYLGMDGVIYKVSGKFQGFVGSEDGARYWARTHKLPLMFRDVSM